MVVWFAVFPNKLASYEKIYEKDDLIGAYVRMEKELCRTYHGRGKQLNIFSTVVPHFLSCLWGIRFVSLRTYVHNFYFFTRIFDGDLFNENVRNMRTLILNSANNTFKFVKFKKKNQNEASVIKNEPYTYSTRFIHGRTICQIWQLLWHIVRGVGHLCRHSIYISHRISDTSDKMSDLTIALTYSTRFFHGRTICTKWDRICSCFGMLILYMQLF